MRYAIIGNSGSGKTTLAKRLCEKYRLAHLDLDSIVWEPDQIAVKRNRQAMEFDLERFAREHADWVIEGCYGELVEAVLVHRPMLLFLNPGVEVCMQNNVNRPWEPHKYESKQAQDSMLANLQEWVRGYYERDDDWSLRAHRRLFDRYPGPKKEVVAANDYSDFQRMR